MNGPYHESGDFDDLDFKCKLHFRRNVTFGYCSTGLVCSWYYTKPIVTLLEIADSLGIEHAYTPLSILCFTDLYCPTNVETTKGASINEKMCLLKGVDIYIGSQKSFAEKFGISISALS